MNKIRVGLIAGLASIMSAIIVISQNVLRTRLSSEGVPEWATYGSEATAFVLSIQLVTIVASILMLTIALGGGYYVGRHIDLDQAYRCLIGTVIAGSVAGLALVWIGTRLTMGEFAFSTSGSPVAEMAVIEFVVLAVDFIAWIAEIGLIVVVGMLAGAALAHFRHGSGTPPNPAVADTDTQTPSTRSIENESDTSRSQPVR